MVLMLVGVLNWLMWFFVYTYQGFRQMKIGPIVGTRTWGGVAGMDSSTALIDGTTLALPVVGVYFNVGGFELENRGVVPDIVVTISPQVCREFLAFVMRLLIDPCHMASCEEHNV